MLVNDNTKNETLDIASTDITLHHSIIKSIGSLKGMAKSVWKLKFYLLSNKCPGVRVLEPICA